MTPARWDPASTPAANAARLLPPLVAAYFQAGRQLVAAPPVAVNLHRFRLDGKRLRYAMELFRPSYGPALERYLELLRGAQTHLGDYNDCATLTRMLPHLPGADDEKAGLTQFLDTRAARLYDDFLDFWKVSVDKPGMERRWSGYLRRPR